MKTYATHATSVALTLLAACSHSDDLDDVENARNRVEVVPLPATPCEVRIDRPLPGAQLGAADDVDPAAPGVQLDLGFHVGATCAPSTLQFGVCQRDTSNQVIAPPSWKQGELAAEPNRDYQARVTLSDLRGPQLPCVELSGLAGTEIVRSCNASEVSCSQDNRCHNDTASNVESCGAACARCEGGPNGEPTCNAGKCELRCADGYHYEGGKCRWRPACKSLEKACRGDDCCAVDYISEAPGTPLTVVRGYDASNDPSGLLEWQKDSSYRVSVTPFYLDRYEVTVSRFRRFVEAYETWHLGGDNPKVGFGAQPSVPTSGWRLDWGFSTDALGGTTYLAPPSKAELIKSITDVACAGTHTWTDQPGLNETRPINCVNFWIAFLYCIWDGDSTYSRIPTEAEWNAAAAGGGQQRAYPWSDPPGDLSFDGHAELASGDQLPYEVGSFPGGKGRWGTFDLAGNVHEWVRDTASLSEQAFRYVEVFNDPIDMSNDHLPQQAHALRGGGFKNLGCGTCDPRSRVRTAAREVLVPFRAFNDTGIRCARNY